MEDLARLERAGIDFHAQLVLVPGVNDGPHLDRSLRDLATFGSRLQSIAGVPVGLSRHGQERQSRQMRLSRTCMRTLPGKQIAVRRYHREEALRVISQAEAWQARFEEERGEPFFYLGDEFYLMTGSPVPSAAHYGGFPQIEDGIGITRHFLDSVDSFVRRSKSNGLPGAEGTVACGELIAHTMREAVDRVNAHTGASLDVVSVENIYLGSEINVSGLLTGQDLLATFARRPSRGPLYVSDRMVSQRTGTLLDDQTIEDVAIALGRPVVPAVDLSDVARDLRTRATNRPQAAA
jgi:NifB/MoaA-like Fe-S oxidoreductase